MKRLAVILWMILIPTAQAQISVPNVRLPALPQSPLTSTLTADAQSDLRPLRDVRRLAVRDLIRRNRTVVQADRNGAAIIRGEIVAVSPEQAVVDAAVAAGFAVLRTRVLEGLDAQIVVLGVPAGMDTLRALDKLRALAPATTFDFNHIYLGSGAGGGGDTAGGSVSSGGGASSIGSGVAGGSVGGGSGVSGIGSGVAGDGVSSSGSGGGIAGRSVSGGSGVSGSGAGVRGRLGVAPRVQAAVVSVGAKVGLIDSGVDVAHPVFTDVPVHQHGCSAPVPAAHGTAVASLLVGRSDNFHGSAPGAELYAADVYCGTPTGGAVDAVADAFAWLAHAQVPVINVSLVGPSNITLEAVVRLVIARGHLIVAAVGNDGPAAAPLYPASYPGVVAVTAVDAHRRVLFEAGRGPQVRFAAPGADISAAKSVRTFEVVRGTSFAAPIVAGLLAARLTSPDPTAAQRAVEELAQEAVDLGHGVGLVGADYGKSK